MTLVEIVSIVSEITGILGAVVSVSYRLGKQDRALEFLMRQAEEASKRSGSIPPPREKLTTLKDG